MHKWDLESCARRDSSWTSATQTRKIRKTASFCHLRNMFRIKMNQTLPLDS